MKNAEILQRKVGATRVLRNRQRWEELTVKSAGQGGGVDLLLAIQGLRLFSATLSFGIGRLRVGRPIATGMFYVKRVLSSSYRSVVYDPMT
jgi:hypothetical protein